MPVTRTHQALGGFSINLQSGAIAKEFAARVQPWDHIFVVPKALGPQPDYQSVRNTAVFSGRIDEIEMDSTSLSVSGPSNAVWLGDAQGNGATGTGTTGPTAQSLANWLTTGLIANVVGDAGLSYGRVQNLQTGNITFFRDQLKTWRQWIGELQDLCDFPFEWHVNPSGTVDIEGFITNDLRSLIFDWFPYVAIGDTMERTEGISRYSDFDRQLQVFGGDISVTWDFSRFARTGVAVGNNSPPTVRTNDKNFFGPLPGRFDTGALVAWATTTDAQTDVTAQLDNVARITAQYASIRREWSVTGGSAEIGFHLKPGDWIWLHADNLPGIGSQTYAQEQSEWAGVSATTTTTQRFPEAAFVNIAGRTVYPVRARVSSIQYPVSDRWHDVYWVSTWDRSGDVTLLNPWMDWDPDGPATIECNASKPIWQLLVPTAETRLGRVRETASNVRAATRRF